MKQKKKWFSQGIERRSPPSVSAILPLRSPWEFAAKGIGLTAPQAAAMSLTNLTSAGEFAALGLISAGASYGEMALTQLIINLRTA